MEDVEEEAEAVDDASSPSRALEPLSHTAASVSCSWPAPCESGTVRRVLVFSYDRLREDGVSIAAFLDEG